MSETSRSVHDLNADLFATPEEERQESPIEARKKAMDYLARREYGGCELGRKLAAAGFSAQAVDAALAQLRSEGLQDDRRFIESFIRSRINRGKGPVRIRVELEQRGLESSLIDAGLAEADVDWISLANRVREQKFGTDSPRDFKEKARQMRFLQYRGFESSHIQASVSACNQ